MKCKVFGIGLSKTGTTSLAKALQVLGYNVVHFPELTSFFSIIEISDGAADTPVCLHYPTLEKIYPTAKFILTTRDLASWTLSAKKHFNKWAPASKAIMGLRLALYKSVIWDENKFVNSYIQYNEDALNFFALRKEKLLVTNIIEQPNWDALCSFLNHPIPDEPFPNLNKSQATF